MESIGTSSVRPDCIGEAYIERRAPADRRHMPESARPTNAFAPHAVRVAALWVLAGAASKAATGMPTDLPFAFSEMDVDPVSVITLGTLVECAVAVFALCAPRAGRIPLALLLGGFACLLLHHMANTDASCGCFGGASIPAPAMLGADLAFLGLVCWTFRKPPAPSGTTRVIVGVLAAVLVGGGLAAYASGRLSHAVAGEQPTAPVATPPSQAAVQPAPPTWSMPTEIPEQVILRPLQWIGKPLAETPLGTWVDTAAFPAKARMIFFYKSCNHCAALLKELAEKQAADPASAPTYVLIQLPTPAAYKGKLFVETVPTHALWVELPAVIKAYVMTPPWIVDIDGGKVVHAERVPWPGEKAAGK